MWRGLRTLFKPSRRKRCDHEWWVVSTVLTEVVLQTQCRKCARYGDVPSPSLEEWERAFHAPSNPYPWDQPERVRTYGEDAS